MKENTKCGIFFYFAHKIKRSEKNKKNQKKVLTMKKANDILVVLSTRKRNDL